MNVLHWALILKLPVAAVVAFVYYFTVVRGSRYMLKRFPDNRLVSLLFKERPAGQQLSIR